MGPRAISAHPGAFGTRMVRSASRGAKRIAIKSSSSGRQPSSARARSARGLRVRLAHAGPGSPLQARARGLHTGFLAQRMESQSLRLRVLRESLRRARDHVGAAGNPQLARMHHDITERIRIIRRLDFTQPDRIDSTYEEHAQILRAVMRRRLEQSRLLLKTHIEASKA